MNGLSDTEGQASSLRVLALLFAEDCQVDAAEEAASRAANISSDNPSKYQLPEHHHILGHIYYSRGEAAAAIDHLKTALELATSFSLQRIQASVLCCLLRVLLEEGRLDDARAHLEKSDAVNHIDGLYLAAVIQVCVWRQQSRVEEAESEIWRVIDMCQKIGVPADSVQYGKGFFREVEEKANNPAASGI